MSPGPRENRPRCRSARIFRRSVICRFRSLFSELFRSFFGTAGSKRPEFMRLSAVFSRLISGSSERSEASKSVGWAERCARSAQQGSQTNARIMAPTEARLATTYKWRRQKRGRSREARTCLAVMAIGLETPNHTGCCSHMRPLSASIGKSPLGAARSHRLRRFLQACRAHRRV